MTHCDRGRLKRLLDDTLPEAVEKHVAEHVDSCPDCQADLEELAAARAWWVEAKERLSKSSLAGTFLRDASSVNEGIDSHDSIERSGSQDGFANGSSHDGNADHFAADFAVDFLEPSNDPEMLGRLGEYEIVQIIGRGGMGIVLKGYQKELHRHVAVKVLAPHLATSGAARRRFAREAQATAAIVHPHVMAIHSVQANVKLPYLVMPFVACESLQERLDRHGPLETKDILRIGMQAALGLAAAHAQGLVHRDVKPANILLETNVDRVMLTDFGLARAVDDATLTRTGIIAGTPQYMSPEQANGDAVDHRSDLFSLGGVLYAMCTGRPPFRAETTFGVLRRIRETAPRSIREINPDIPDWLERIVMRLLSKDAAARFETAETVASVLERCLAHVQQPTTTSLPQEIEDWGPASSLAPMGQQTRRGVSRFVWIPSLSGLAILVAIILFASWPRARPVSIDSADTSSSSALPDPDFSDRDLEWNAASNELESVSHEFDTTEAASRTEIELLDSSRQDIP